MKITVLWIGTSYPPAPGGGSMYAKMITEGISRNHKDCDIRLVVEKYPSRDEKEYVIDNLFVDHYFPFRGGRDKKGLMSYPRYALQNLLLVSLFLESLTNKVDVVIFHSWYFSNPSLGLFVAKLFKRVGVRVILDARDVSFSKKTLMKMNLFDAIISCGKRVSNHLKTNPQLKEKIKYIPTPFNPVFVDDGFCKKLMLRYGVESGEYIFSPSGISNEKSFLLLYNTWCEVVSTGRNIDLVVAGKERSSMTSYEEKVGNSRFVFVGKLDSKSIHGFYNQAALSINVSRNEGLPRVPLEAVHHQTPLIFPPETPEFDDSFPDSMVANSDDPKVLAKNINYLIDNKLIAADYYDVTKHSIDNAANSTYVVFENIVNK